MATISLAVYAAACTAPAQPKHSPALVEEVKFDWDHSGVPTSFALFQGGEEAGLGDADRLVIRSKTGRPWTLINHDDAWGAFEVDGTAARLQKQNLVTSKRLLFVAAGTTVAAPVYLILKGAGYGCCVGSLTVITTGHSSISKVVFHAEQHLLDVVKPISGAAGIEIIGQASDSEALGLQNTQSYDPYRAYLLIGDKPARYDLALSRTYTIAHYCEWAGPTYNEHRVAVGDTTGAATCRAMTEAQFDRYLAEHPRLSGQP